MVLNTIGPVWDGNEVWLITAGGALFAAFPMVYGTVFAGFYLAIMLLLAALILRAISIEFRSMETFGWWRAAWDIGFAAGSGLAALLFGVALGNLLRGIAIDPVTVLAANGTSSTSYAYTGGFVGLLNPFALEVGFFTLGLAALQGASWLVLKTEGTVQARARKAQAASLVVVLLAWVAATVVARAEAPRLFDNFGNLLAWAGPLLTINVLIYMIFAIRNHQDRRAFFFSSLSIVGFATTAATALYPNLVPAVDKARSLTVANSHSSDLTLTVMLAVALIGMPIVLAYTAFIYWKFKGKVTVSHESY
jgi:cytochrome d ubiquinol oxidase subunit II